MRRPLVAALACLSVACVPAVAAAQVASDVHGLRWSQRYAHPGQNLWATYTASAQTTVSFAIRDADGHSVRDLGDDVSEAPGKHAVDWEGYGQNTRPLRDGHYALVLTDPTGTLSAPITLDTVPPTGAFLTPTLTKSSTLVIALHDGLSGIKDAALGLNGRYVAVAGRGATRMTYRPKGGWKPGTYPFTAYVTDNAGNHAQAYATYVVAKPRPKKKKKHH